MSRYVDAEKMPSGSNWEALNDEEKATVLSFLIKLPTADVEEVRHGEWIDTGSGQKCSVCGEIQYGYDSYRHRCSYCGAKMDGGKE